MSTVFHLPDVGEGLTEAEIISWKVAAGQEVAVNQVLVEIETAKSLVELPSPEAGVIGALLVEEGTTVEVGTPLVRYGADAPGADESGATLVGYGAKESSSARRPRRGRHAAPEPSREAPPEPAREAAPRAWPQAQTPPVAAAEEGAAPEAPRAAPEAPPAAPQEPAPESAPSDDDANRSTPGRALAKPPVRKLARDLGIDLASVAASGPRGEVTREDVQAAAGTGASVGEADAGTQAEAAAEAGGTAAPGSSAHGSRETLVPLKGVRKATAQAMVRSAFTIPHVTEFLEVDATGTMEFVARAKASALLGAGVRVNPMLIAAKAVCWAALRHPEMNASYGDDAITIKNYVNLGIAAATPRGLVVPNIKDAHAMGLTELAGALGDLVETARAGRTTPAAQAGGTITLTNVGVFGVDSGTPIINPGESAIVAFGQIRPKPWVVDGEVVARQVTTLAVSADHRVVDGVTISQFLSDLGRALEDPTVMLA